MKLNIVDKVVKLVKFAEIFDLFNTLQNAGQFIVLKN